MPAPDPLTYRCRRDWRCENRQPSYDDQGALLGWEGDRPEGNAPDGLCTTCVGRYRAAMRRLPMLLLDLNAQVGKDATASPLDDSPGVPGKKKPLPIRTQVEAVRAALAAELVAWAEDLGFVLDEELLRRHVIGPLEWGVDRLARLALDARVAVSLGFLQRRADRLRVIGPVPHAVDQESLLPQEHDTAHVMGSQTRQKGHAPAPVAWTWRDGTDAAITFLDLVDKAEKVTGHAWKREESSVGCTACGRGRMCRWPGDSEWTCPRCHHARRDDHHDVLLEALLTSRPGAPA